MIPTDALTRARGRWSLTAQLLVTTGIGLGILLVAVMASAYYAGRHESDEITDGYLASVAVAIPIQTTDPAAPARTDAANRFHAYQRPLFVALWDRDARLLTHSPGLPDTLPFPQPGFRNYELAGDRFRGFSTQRPDGTTALVLIQDRSRQELARDLAEHVIEPMLWLVPVLGVIMAALAVRALAPWRRLAEAVRAFEIERSDRPLASLDQPSDIRAAAAAVDDLVQRFRAALAREKDQAGLFAHELRTPITAARLSLHELRAEAGDRIPGTLIADVDRPLVRAGLVIDHLLELARVERELANAPREPVDLLALSRSIVAELAVTFPRHDADIEGTLSVNVLGHEILLGIAVRNLVHNAFVHNPPGSRVSVEVIPDPPAVSIRSARAVVSGWTDEHVGLRAGRTLVERIARAHGVHHEVLGPIGEWTHVERLRWPSI